MAKKKSMSVDEQGELIDVHPETVKEIIEAAKDYKKILRQKKNAMADERILKDKLLSMIKDAGYKPLDDGSIRFSADGFNITLVPRDEAIKVENENDFE